jgi:hypothetical protein
MERATKLVERIRQFDPAATTVDETTQADLRELFATLQPVFDGIDSAQRFETCAFSTGMKVSQVLPHIAAVHDFSRVGALHIRSLKDSETFEEVTQAIDRMLRLSRDVQPRGPMIQHLVGQVVLRQALEGIQLHLLNRATLTAEECQTLIEMIQTYQSKSIDPLHEAIRVEYVILGNSLYGLEDGSLDAKALGFDGMSPETVASINFDLEWKTLNGIFQFVIDDYLVAAYHEVLKEHRFVRDVNQLKQAAKALMQKRPKPGKLFSQSLIVALSMPEIQRFWETTARREVMLGGVKSLLVVRRFELRHGRTPDTLVEAYEDAAAGDIPVDPFCGEPLRYRILNNHVCVYSTGKDQVDDQAEADWNLGRQPGDYIFRTPVWNNETRD